MEDPKEFWMGVANIAQAFVPLFSLSAYIPQWVRLVRRQASADLSIPSWCLWAVCYAVATFYAGVMVWVTGRGWALVATTSLGFSFVCVTLVLVLRYRRLERRDAARSGRPA